MKLQWTWFVFVLLFLLQFFLHGCGAKTLDPETAALAEGSDAVCLARIMGHDTEEADDGTIVLTCKLTRDYLGSLTERGTALGPGEDRYIFLRVENSWFQEEAMPRPWAGEWRLLLFLRVTEERREAFDRELGKVECVVFVPNGEAGLRWEPIDAEGLRYGEAIREYGKAHPREPLGEGISWGIPYPVYKFDYD